MAFYRDILGIPFLFSAPPQMAFFICGSVRLLVGVPPEGEEQRSAAAVYFGIADIQAAFASLKAKDSMVTPLVIYSSRPWPMSAAHSSAA